MKKILDFTAPPACYGNNNFETCFHAAAMFLDGRMEEGIRRCGQAMDGECGHCGLGQMYNVILGWPFYRRAFGNPPDNTRRYNVFFNEQGGRDDILFGYAGYEYRVCDDSCKFKEEVAESINVGRPVIASIKSERREETNSTQQLIIGYDNSGLVTPQYSLKRTNAEGTVPVGELAYEDIWRLHIFGKRVAPKYTYADILKRNLAMIESNVEEKVWDEYIEAIDGIFILQQGNGEARANLLAEIREATSRYMACWDFGAVHNDGLFEELHKGFYDHAPANMRWVYPQFYGRIWQNNCEGMDTGHFINHCQNHMKVESDNCHFIYFGKMLKTIMERYRELDIELYDLMKRLVGTVENAASQVPPMTHEQRDAYFRELTKKRLS